MTLQDKIAEIIDREMIDSMGDYSSVADAILAALPDMVAPLVWQNNGNHWAGGHGYVVRKIGGQYTLTVRNAFDRQFDLLEEAQAAASAHHAAAVVAAFTGEKP